MHITVTFQALCMRGAKASQMIMDVMMDLVRVLIKKLYM